MLGDLFSVSLSMSVVIAALLLLSPLLGKRYAAKWRCFLWLAVAVRLLIPVSVSLPEAPVRIPAVSGTVLSQAQQETVPAEMVSPAERHEPVQAPSKVIRAEDVLFLLWAAGAVFFLLRHLIGYVLFRRSLRPWCVPVTEGKPPVRLCRKIKSPMLLGFLHPVILLPDKSYREEELDMILSHEMAHYQRKDVWYKLLLIAANAMHWFNPLVYVMTRFANRDLEFSCDDMVTKNRDMTFRKTYSKTILQAVQNERASSLSTCFKGGKKEMKQRFANILSKNKKKTGAFLLAVVLLAVGAIGALVACGGNTIVYQNPALGFSMELPADWEGRYVIVENGDTVTVSHKKIREGYGNGMGDLFYVQRLEGSPTEEEANEPGGRTVALRANGYTYVFGIPTDVRYPAGPEGDAALSEEYLQMSETALRTVKNSLKAITPDGSVPASDITRLYAYRGTYTGDNAGVRNLAGMLDFVGIPVHSIQLQTDQKPYGITINYKVDSRADYRFVNERGFEQTMAVLFALIPNADEIRCAVYDNYSDLDDPDTAFAGAYGARTLLHERSGMEAFTEEAMRNAAETPESFTDYFHRVSELPLYRTEGGNAMLTAKYAAIGNDCELVINSMLTRRVVVTEELLNQPILREWLPGNPADWKAYQGKELEFQMQDVRNFKTGETNSWLFVFEGDALHLSKKLKNDEASKLMQLFRNR